MILVTGANGFIGSQLVHDLNRRGFTDIFVTDYVNEKERPQPLKAAKYVGFFDPDSILENLDNCNIQVIFHIGACSSTTETNWEYLKKVNLDYTKKLFAYAAEKDIPFYYASSGAVYGDGELGFDDQTDPADFSPLNLYGKSKADMDIWALDNERKPSRWAGFRYFNVYGPNEYHKGPMASLVFKAFGQINETKKLKLFKSYNSEYKDGEQMRDFIYVKDVTNWMIEVWQMENFKSGIYNMGSGQAQSWLDLAEGVFAAMNSPMKIDWIDVPENIRDQYQYFTEAKMQSLFDQRINPAKWSLHEGIKDYITNYLGVGHAENNS